MASTRRRYAASNALMSRDWMRREVLGRDIVMRTDQDGTATGKYGRWLGEIYRAQGDAVSINQDLMTNGLAVTASY